MNTRTAVMSVLSGLFAAYLISLAIVPDSAFAQAKLVPVKVGILKIAGMTSAYAAKQDKIFERNGLDVTLVEFRQGAESVTGVQSGAVDIINTITGTGMTAYERGFDLLAIFQNEIVHDEGPDSGSLQVRANSDIRTMADLVGKKIGVPSVSSQMTVTAQVAMRKAGIDPSKMQYIEVPFPRQFDVLKSGQVDAVVATDPFTTQMMVTGVGRVLSWTYAEALPGSPLGIWYAKRAYINKNPDVIERFNRSIKEAIDNMNANPAKARQQVVEFTGLDMALVEKMRANKLDYRVRPSKWQEVADMMIASKIMEKKIPVQEYFADQLKPYIQN